MTKWEIVLEAVQAWQKTQAKRGVPFGSAWRKH